MINNWLHVTPVNDLKLHKHDGFDCECEPQIDWDNNLIIHNSFDGRESVEWAKQILNEEAGNEN